MEEIITLTFFILLITWKSGRITNIVFSFVSVVMTCLEFQLWSAAVDITNFEDRKVSSMDMYCLWDRIYEGISEKIMNSYEDFTKETFPRVASSLFFFDDKYRYFLR